MHHYQDIQSLGWMKDKTNKRIQSLPRRQGLVIYFDVSNRKPAFLNSFHLLCWNEPGTVAHMRTQISSAFSMKSAKSRLSSIEQRG
jgi:hypothetical protein